MNRWFNHSVVLVILCITVVHGMAQTYFAQEWLPQVHPLYKLNINSSCTENCLYEFIGSSVLINHNSAMSQSGQLYSLSDNLYLIDTTTGAYSVYYVMPTFSTDHYNGLIEMGNEIFYSTLSHFNFGDTLIEINTNTGIVQIIGELAYPVFGGISDMAIFDGEIYYLSCLNHDPNLRGIAKFNPADPLNGEWVLSTSGNAFIGEAITASNFCNTLMATDAAINKELLYLNVVDGVLSHPCQGIDNINSITSMQEFLPPTICNVIELDCDDSSGAMGYNYASQPYDCHSNGSPVADTDVNLWYDDFIIEMEVQISGSIPDGLLEFLEWGGSAPNLMITGDGTSAITLTSDGTAISSDFVAALQQIMYQNDALNPTPGPRTIVVQFTTASGSTSNTAIAFVEVIPSAAVNVDMGPDQQICEGTSVLLNAGHPGSDYAWSTGEDSQTIEVDQSGVYSVTVSDGNLCPGMDLIQVEVLPVIQVSLTGDNEICDNGPASLLIATNTPFTLTVEITADPGGSFAFSDVNGDFAFTDWPSQPTTYTITSVSSIQEACIDITDADQIIEVHPTYNQSVDVDLCEGDSIWLGYGWESSAGVYENTLNTIYGCDSVVTTHINVLPAVMISRQSTTCDPGQAGVFITHLENPTGCDTIVQTIVLLLATDTTYINGITCHQALAGIWQDTLSGVDGCDSLVIHNISYMPPADTTMIQSTSCDSAAVGVWPNMLTGVDGCDSLVISTVTFTASDTTSIFTTSCDTLALGVFQYTWIGTDGCDSLVISTVTFATSDTTYIYGTSCDTSALGIDSFMLTGIDGCDSLVISSLTYAASDTTYTYGTSCDPSSTGVWQYALTGVDGCDSLVISTITLAPTDSTFICSSSCDTAMVGVWQYQLTNQFGCDSIVTQTVSWLPSDQTVLHETTCVSAEAGTFMTSYFNQYGCDSVVIRMVTLQLADTTHVYEKTCNAEETGVIETVYTGQNGCDSLVVESITLYPLPLVSVLSAIDYHGYDVSCYGQNDGSIVTIVQGEGPLTYSWSGGQMDATLEQLMAGSYLVTVTDGNGCSATGGISLDQPDAFKLGFTITEPDCFDARVGSIMVEPKGGVSPFRYSIDGAQYQTSPLFSGLTDGVYQINASDANDCISTEIIWIHVPLQVNVDLGPDHVISLGDSVGLEAVINLPFDSLASIQWTGLDSVDCPTCLKQLVYPVITTAYSISVMSNDGCPDRDSLTVSVHTDHSLYIPNIFSPNGDGINDAWLLSAGEDVKEIQSLAIFDRWGNLVYSAEKFLPNDLARAWDGNHHGKPALPGVYTYKLLLTYKDAAEEVRYGDLTLVR